MCHRYLRGYVEFTLTHARAEAAADEMGFAVIPGALKKQVLEKLALLRCPGDVDGCSTGFYWDSADLLCRSCEAGSTTRSTTDSSCFTCPSGSRRAFMEYSECLPCSAGYSPLLNITDSLLDDLIAQ